MEYLQNVTFDEIKIGDTAALARTLTEKDIQVFAIMSGDINPAHVDVDYAQSDMFHKIIGHGMWGGALISTVLGTQLPGPGTIYVGQTLHFKKPVAVQDTLTVKVTAIEKKPEKKRIIFACECRNQKDEVVMEGQAEVVAPTKKIRRPKTVLPEISLRRPYSLFDRYVTQAKPLGPLRAAVIFPTHPMVFAAVLDAKQAGMVLPVFIGHRDRMLAAAAENDYDITHDDIIEAGHPQIAIAKSIALARQEEVKLLIRGGATNEELLRALQKPDKGLLTDRHMSYVSVLDVPTYHKALILTDTLVNISPDLDCKRAIIQNAIHFVQALEIDQPRVAVLAGADMVTSSLRSTIDAAALCKMAERGQIKGAIIDGPLTFDNIISKEAANAKGRQSEVVGNADIVLVPNVETGNILVEQLKYSAESRNAGLLLGAKIPVLMSHISDIHTSTAACALAILANHSRQINYDQSKELS